MVQVAIFTSSPQVPFKKMNSKLPCFTLLSMASNLSLLTMNFAVLRGNELTYVHVVSKLVPGLKYGYPNQSDLSLTVAASVATSRNKEIKKNSQNIIQRIKIKITYVLHGRSTGMISQLYQQSCWRCKYKFQRLWL